MGHADATGEGQRLTASSNVQHGKPLGLGLGSANNVRQQSGHVVDVDKLNAFRKIMLPVGQHTGKALALIPHSRRALCLAIRGAAKSAEHVVLHAGTGKNMWTEHVDAASSQ